MRIRIPNTDSKKHSYRSDVEIYPDPTTSSAFCPLFPQFEQLLFRFGVMLSTAGCLKSRTSLKVTSVLCLSTGEMSAVS